MPYVGNHDMPAGIPPTKMPTIPAPSAPVPGHTRKSNANGLLRVALVLLIVAIAIGGLLMIAPLLLTYIHVSYEVSLLLFLGWLLAAAFIPLALMLAIIFGIVGFMMQRNEREARQRAYAAGRPLGVSPSIAHTPPPCTPPCPPPTTEKAIE